jgi:hypothetical protein
MEEVLEVYTQLHDPEMPPVCPGEASKQPVSGTRTPIPMKPGQPERAGYGYERNGTVNLFMLFAPLQGWRHVEVTDHRKATGYARILNDLPDVHFPRAKKAVPVQDNLNTHAKASHNASLPARRGQADRGTLRMARHTQAWQLAQHGGIRIGRSGLAMPGPPQQKPCQGRLALHNS